MYINKACARACVSLASQTPEKTVFMYNVERERDIHMRTSLHTPHTPHNTLPISNKYAIHTHTHTQKYTTMCIYIYVHMYVCVVFCSTLRIWHARG